MPQILYQTQFAQGKFVSFDGTPDLKFFKVHQVHSAELVEVTQTALESEHLYTQQKADGLFCNWGNRHPLAVVTADCLPILVMGIHGWSMIHAGWKGLSLGILKHQSLRNLRPQFALIGPAIHLNSYQVGEDFRAHFPSSRHLHRRGNHIYFDLIHEASDQLRETYPSIQVSESGLCTFEDHRFHSFRRDKTSQRNYHLFIPS